MKNTPIIVDSSALLHRAKNTIGTQLSFNDVASGVIFGFLWQIFKLAKNYETMNFVFAMDSKKSHRRNLFPDYKMHRRNKEKTEEEKEFDKHCYSQFNEVFKYLKKMGFSNTRKIKGLEADDIAASYLINNEMKNAILVSGDHDFYQLLPYCKGMLSLSTGKLYSAADFIIEWNIGPKEWKKVLCLSGCFDEKTEILTNNGWKKFYCLENGDKVFSMDPITKKSEYCKINKYIEYDYSGEMYKIKGENIDALVTPNHSFFGDTSANYCYGESKPKFKTISEILSNCKNFTVPTTVSSFIGIKENKIDEFVNIPDITRNYIGGNGCKGKTVVKGMDIPLLKFMAFLGIYLADGYTSKNRNGNIGKIGICKTKPNKVRAIKRILESIGLKYSIEKKSGFIIHNVPLAEYLKPLGDVYSKRIPQVFKDLPSKYLKVLYHYMILCDGYTGKSQWDSKQRKTNSQIYYTVNHGLASDFQEIVVKSGKNCSIKKREGRSWKIKGKSGKSRDQYVVRIKKSKTHNLLKARIEKIKFSGKVYDVETKKYHTILVRRNNTCYWSSNCSGDGVPGIPGVGEKTAIQYLKGELTSGKKFDDIFHYITKKKDYMDLMEKMVVLPFYRTPKLRMKPNELNFDAFIELCQTYNFLTFLDNPKNFLDWKNLFNGTYTK